MFESPIFWTAISALGAVGAAIATFMTYFVVKRYTDETQKLRETANEQLKIMSQQTDLNSRSAAAQTVLTFTFGKFIPKVSHPEFGDCWAYPLIVEGKGFQNLTAVSEPPSTKRRFALLDFNDNKGILGSLATWSAEITHVLLIVSIDPTGFSIGSAERFRLTYVDALRNARWDEFNFEAYGGIKQWQPVWLRSGYIVTADLTMQYDIEGNLPT